VILMIYLHAAALYGLYLAVTGQAKWQTLLLASILELFGGLGITAGAHRLWAHRSYKAKLPLRILLGIWNTIAFQNSIHEWTRVHRVHHKFTETHADPHNARRGFFFSHVGWLLSRKHPDVINKGKTIDLSDLERDPIVTFQRNHYIPLLITFCFVIPTSIPMYFWGESFTNSWHIAALLKYVITLNITWLVNSAAHLWGDRPYDKFINPAENLFVAVAAFGEGWHNYHHVYPWDYKTAELGNYRFNLTTGFIDFMHFLGLAYDLKTVDPAMIHKRVLRTGDGSHKNLHNHDHAVWGWGDKDLKQEDIDMLKKKGGAEKSR